MIAACELAPPATLGELGRGQCRQNRGLSLRCPVHRSGRRRAFAHGRHGGLDESRVRGDQCRNVDDGRLLAAPGTAQPLGERSALRGDGGERVPYLVSGGGSGVGQVGDVQPARRDARGDGQSPEAGNRAHRACRSATSRSARRIRAVDAAPGSS